MVIIKTILTTFLSLAVLLILSKLIGNKQLSQMNLFDYINGITIGSIAAEVSTEEMGEIVKPLTAMIVYGLVTAAISVIVSKSRRARKVLSGKATILMNNGKIYREELKKTKLDLDEFLAMLRVDGFFDITQIQTVILEPNGRLSVLPKAEYRPLNPNDSNIPVTEEYIFYNVIMDGEIIQDNLRRAGKDERWLMQELKRQKYDSVGDIFLACCDANNTLNVFKNI